MYLVVTLSNFAFCVGKELSFLVIISLPSFLFAAPSCVGDVQLSMPSCVSYRLQKQIQSGGLLSMAKLDTGRCCLYLSILVCKLGEFYSYAIFHAFTLPDSVAAASLQWIRMI